MTRIPLTALLTLGVGSLITHWQAQAAPFDIEVQTGLGHEIPKSLYGLFFEDIRHSGDGGLYSELLQNRAFQQLPANKESSLYPWGTVGNGGTIQVVDGSTAPSLTSALPNSLQLKVPSEQGAVGFSQGGYWGIPAKKGSAFVCFFWVKIPQGTAGELIVSLTSFTNKNTIATSTVNATKTTDWQRLETVLHTTLDPPNALNNFTITADSNGWAKGQTLEFAMFSLQPQETYKGRLNGMRNDLAQSLLDLKPSFFRLPGGNNLEGEIISSRWKWNNTIGPLKERPGRMGDWGYVNDDGLGLLEYLTFCEDAGMDPMMAVWAGYTLGGTSVPEDQLEPYVQVAIDQINFAIGDASSNKWAALRASYGHPKPFNLKWVEIGNEDFFSTTYTYRWQAFATAIQKAFPKLPLISTSLPQNPPLTPEPKIWDLHYYNTPNFYIQNSHIYDGYTRNGTQYVITEWAVSSRDESCSGKTKCGRNQPFTMQDTSAEAAFAIGFERNSDIVTATAYGIALQRAEMTDWTTNLIRFNSSSQAKSTSYYFLQMFGQNLGDSLVQSTLPQGGNPVQWGVSYRKTSSEVIIKLANAGSSSATIDVSLPDYTVKGSGTATLLAGKTVDSTNTLAAPNTVVPKSSSLKTSSRFSYTLPGYSVAILRIPASPNAGKKDKVATHAPTKIFSRKGYRQHPLERNQ